MLLASSHRLSKTRETEEQQALKVIRSEPEVENIKLNYFFWVYLSTKVRDPNSRSTDALCHGGQGGFRDQRASGCLELVDAKG